MVCDNKLPAAIIGGVLVGTVLLLKSRRKKRPVAVGQIAELVIYPVKSLGGISVPQLLVNANSCVSYGALYDRQFSLIDVAEEVGLSLYAEPRLAVIDTTIHVTNSGTQLWFDAPDTETLKVTVHDLFTEELCDKVVNVKLCKNSAKGVDYGEEVGAWFVRVLQKENVRLVQHLPPLANAHVHSNHVMPESQERKFPIFYQDWGTILFANTKSLADLNSRLPEGAAAVEMSAFRPNVVIGADRPWAEDDWKELHIGGHVFRYMFKCGRCLATMAEKATGKRRADREPLKTLNGFRVPTDPKEKKDVGGLPFSAVILLLTELGCCGWEKQSALFFSLKNQDFTVETANTCC